MQFQIMDMRTELHEFIDVSKANKQVNHINKATVADFDERLETVVE